VLKLRNARIVDISLRLMRDEQAATAIEYALIASGGAVAIAATVVNLGVTVKACSPASRAMK
jgi:Flp pilus assembly pilin Flp